MQNQWTEVDRYFDSLFAADDPALDAALQSSAEAGLPAIHVSPTQGKLLHLLARLAGGGRILEIGTLGGYSAIWMARSLAPGGKLISLEVNPKHVEVARANVARAGLAESVEIRLGPALELLPSLEEDGGGPFDLIFIDADKPSNPEYVRWALRLSHPGSVIVVDNVVRDGKVADADSVDSSVQGSRATLEILASDPRVDATAVQTVGSKGYDGFAVAVVR